MKGGLQILEVAFQGLITEGEAHGVLHLACRRLEDRHGVLLPAAMPNLEFEFKTRYLCHDLETIPPVPYYPARCSDTLYLKTARKAITL